MARVTRSKRIDIVEDHTALAINTPLPDTPAKHLQTLANFNNPMGTFPMGNEEERMASELRGLKAAYKVAIGAANKVKKASKGRAKKGKQAIEADLENSFNSNNLMQHEEVAPTATSSPGQILTGGKGNSRSPSENYAIQILTPGLVDYLVEQEQKVKLPAPASRMTRQQLAKAQAAEEVTADMSNEMEPAIDTNKAAPAAIETSNNENPITIQAQKDSYTSQGRLNSPVKTLEEVERAYASEQSTLPADDTEEDSFVQQITARSPAKPVSRIEDSVEALDQFEEALEAIDQATLAERMISPEKKRIDLGQTASPGKTTTGKQNGTRAPAPKTGYSTVRVKSTAPKHAPVLKKATSMNFKPSPAENKAKAQPTKAAVKRPASLLPPKETAKSTKPPTRSTFELPGEAVARRLKEQREARLAQRESSEDSFRTARVVSGPKTTKSTKPLTKPTFELPGEAVSRRKREAHEARLKAQEEEERKRREFKARPIRNSTMPSVAPRDTISSRARQSKIGLESMTMANEDISIAKRGSNVGAHRPSIIQLNAANISAPRSKAAPPVRKPSPTTHGPSMSGRAMQRSVSVHDVQIQRQRAKEIYNRDNKLSEDISREKRDREDAAKRAREEAAERGRQASREWAERQMAKKTAEGDKGMNAGFGPGGQLGLRG